ncbi:MULTISPECIES: ROK family protein [Actinomycetes]|uniref:ROK family protein n=1 Tax=Actinomycetes TaxID=1760 RepID=UPI001656F851|nr:MULTISPECIES: ROK family protein [unclassified Microbacterium]MDH5133788.1 ROK family protein [Microbacterium sp. RD10]MDH5138586.1 ROK family protein [Microbacterium sp. RD11]MDH5144781.1 ROK family protein [Microbacterium sp. RD12]MDH5156599.1 ROK family protein [Microbacterium sp. RD06]MDH5166930.1 ROK family protein [Microbacterium sp. RD02]
MFTHDDALDTQAAVRRANLRRALQLVFQASGSQTRAGIARATGLTAATASSLVAELIEHRLIAEGEQAVSTGGKRATTLSIDAEHHLILVLVVQPTSAYLALVALDGSEVARRSVSYTTQTRDRVLDETVAEVVAAYGARLLAVGVQVPGTTDGRTVLESVQLEWHEVPLAERFETIAGVPVLLVNDVDAEAIAEAGLDAAPSGYRLFIHSGGGIGAAVTLDGELAPGPRDRAGEIGHVQVVFGEAARPCRCGRRGCLESAAAMGPMLGEEFSDALDVPAVRTLVSRADQTLIDDGARALARAIKLIGALLDPIEVVIGGPATELGPRFLERVRAESGYPARGTADVPIRYADPRVAPSAGAAQAALTAVLGVRWSPEQLRAGGPRP